MVRGKSNGHHGTYAGRFPGVVSVELSMNPGKMLVHHGRELVAALPRVLVIPGVMTLKTLGDVRTPIATCRETTAKRRCRSPHSMWANQMSMKRLSRDEAFLIAVNIAKLPSVPRQILKDIPRPPNSASRED